MVIHEKYEVLEILGKGGSGVVYKVLEKGSERILAVKEIALSCTKERDFPAREARIMKECFHPALPVILESFRRGNCYYIVMEYVEGMTLKEYVEKQGRLSLELTVKLGTALSEALSYLHTRNQPIVYGDLKPENLILTKEGKLRLLDFGTAEWETEQGNAAGCYASPGYAAPEQKRGKKAEITSDIYSFGAMLHYMLTGEDPCRPPYIRRKLRDCDGAFPKGLERLVERCLMENPEDRYQSVTAVIDLLQKYGKKEHSAKMFLWANRIVGGFLGVASVCFGFFAFARGRQGISFRENAALFECILFAVFAIFWRISAMGNGRNRYAYRLEKNVWKTDKQGVGFFLLCLGFLLAGCVSFGFGVKAGRQEERLPVTIYDESGCKVCLQEESVYPLSGAFRLEVPAECFPSGQVSRVTVTLTNSVSEEVLVRQFAICPRKSSIEN